MKLAIVGAGWAGMAAAVEAVERGWHVTVFEATREPGGRARLLTCQRPDGKTLKLDNGQHILIGAYSATLKLMQRVGVDIDACLLATPLAMPYPDGSGLQTPHWASNWPSPFNATAAIATAPGWSWSERGALMLASVGWRLHGFTCPPGTTVAQLCKVLPKRAMEELIEPLCVSALNLPAAQACAQVFLRVMRDALFGPGFGAWSGSNLLLPRCDLSSLFPLQAERWLNTHFPDRYTWRPSSRVSGISKTGPTWTLSGTGWQSRFDQVIWATSAAPAGKAMASAAKQALSTGQAPTALALSQWAHAAQALDHTAIATVYVWAPEQRLTHPMLALRAQSSAHESPAQFVFDRGQLHPDDVDMQGVLAFVASASEGQREDVQARVLQQARDQLGLHHLQVIQTVVEKRATFACTPGLVRPPQTIAPGLLAAGDFVEGAYPATLEGAVRSAHSAAMALTQPTI